MVDFPAPLRPTSATICPDAKLQVEVEDTRAIAELPRDAVRRRGRDRSLSITAGEHP